MVRIQALGRRPPLRSPGPRLSRPPTGRLATLSPLALLLVTGLYLFVLPYAARWRGGRHTGT